MSIDEPWQHDIVVLADDLIGVMSSLQVIVPTYLHDLSVPLIYGPVTDYLAGVIINDF